MAQTMVEAFQALAERCSDQRAERITTERMVQASESLKDWDRWGLEKLRRTTASRFPGHINWDDVEDAVQTAFLVVLQRDSIDLTSEPPPGHLPLFGLLLQQAGWSLLGLQRHPATRSLGHSIEQMVEEAGDVPMADSALRPSEIDATAADLRLLARSIRHLLDTTVMDDAEIAEEVGAVIWVVRHVRREHTGISPKQKKSSRESARNLAKFRDEFGREWNRENIIRAFTEFQEKWGRPPGLADIIGNPEMPTKTGIIREFGELAQSEAGRRAPMSRL